MPLSEDDRSLLHRVIEESYAKLFQDIFEEEAQHYFKLVCNSIRKIYSYIEPGITSKQIVIFKLINKELDGSVLGEPNSISNFRHLPTSRNVQSLVIQILGDDGYDNVNESSLFWCLNSFDPSLLSQNAIVYEFKDGVECFIGKGQKKPLHTNGQSIFSIPTFSALETALLDYRDKMVKGSTCFILQEIWHDPNRLFLWNGKEYIIRRSLKQYLSSSLRGDVLVKEEYIVDETHPVDIIVTWRNCNRSALIEIKWLGKSRNIDGKITQNFTASRAVSGAKQLANYLESNLTYTPTNITRGYLVILDARRAKLTYETRELSRQDGFKYENSEIEFKIAFHETRQDFSKPIRMFAEPKCLS